MAKGSLLTEDLCAGANRPLRRNQIEWTGFAIGRRGNTSEMEQVHLLLSGLEFKVEGRTAEAARVGSWAFDEREGEIEARTFELPGLDQVCHQEQVAAGDAQIEALIRLLQEIEVDRQRRQAIGELAFPAAFDLIAAAAASGYGGECVEEGSAVHDFSKR